MNAVILEDLFAVGNSPHPALQFNAVMDYVEGDGVVGCPLQSRWHQYSQHEAQTILDEYNPSNRAKRPSKNVKMVKDMMAGVWRNHHQGIAFYADNTLADGQGRLQSFLDSGKTHIWLLTTFGVQRDAAEHVDDQQPRDLTAAAKIMYDLDVEKNFGSISRAMYAGCTKKNATARTRDEEIVFMERHKAALKFLQATLSEIASPAKDRHRTLLRAFILGVAGKAWYHVDRERLKDFLCVVENGVRRDGAVDSEDHAALRVRNWLMNAREQKVLSAGHAGRGEAAKIVEYYVSRFIDKQVVNQTGKLGQIKEDIYPLPEEAK